jgi:hypothetical protein
LSSVEYYTRPNGDQPVATWLDGLAIDFYKVIAAKLDSLTLHGFGLIGNKSLQSITGTKLYELTGGKCRVLLYYDGGRDEFVLLHGFLKKGRVAPREIRRAQLLLDEYLSSR